MAKAFTLRFLLRRRTQDLFVPVRGTEFDRLHATLDYAASHSDGKPFFLLDSIEGRTYAINLADVQAVRFLWDPIELPLDSTRDDSEIELVFRDRPEPLHVDTDTPTQIADLLAVLDGDAEGANWLGFDDEDGEPLRFNSHQLVWLSVPTHLTRVSNEQHRSDDASPEDKRDA